MINRLSKHTDGFLCAFLPSVHSMFIRRCDSNSKSQKAPYTLCPPTPQLRTHGPRLLAVEGEQLQGAVLQQGALQVPQLPVHLGHHCALRQLRAREDKSTSRVFKADLQHKYKPRGHLELSIAFIFTVNTWKTNKA